LEHTADFFFRSYGVSLGECYANAAKAMSYAIVDPKTIGFSVKKTLALEGDLVSLMHDWLGELLFLFDVEGLIFREYLVSVEGGGETYALNAVMDGERFDRGKHVVGAAIKAVTYHGLRVEKQGGYWVAEVLCDI